MNYTDMTKYDLIKTKATSSKGNQMKWLLDNIWYKQDHMGYEGLCEVVISTLLTKSNVENFVKYEPVRIKYKLAEKSGCYSHNFKGSNEIIVTLEHLYKKYKGTSLSSDLAKITDVKERIKYTVEFVKDVTEIKNAGAYFACLLQLDAFFLNEDRHTNNIAFIFNEKTEKYTFAPYFDFGLSLLADTNDYPLQADIFDCMKYVKAKPFSEDFDEQADAAAQLYGDNVTFNFTSHDIDNVLSCLNQYYDNETLKRVKELLLQQKRKYSYLFE